MDSSRTSLRPLGRLAHVEEHGCGMLHLLLSIPNPPQVHLKHLFYIVNPTNANSTKGPITEECLFRSAGVPLLLCAGTGLTGTIFLSPLVFGLAHLHHFYEFRITHPRTPLPVAIARSILQLSYTSLFGAYATFLFLRTGSLFAVILVHAFCNCMGLPRFWGQVEPFWLLEREHADSSSFRLWTAIYYVLLVSGLAAWWKNLYSLTESPMALTGF